VHADEATIITIGDIYLFNIIFYDNISIEINQTRNEPDMGACNNV